MKYLLLIPVLLFMNLRSVEAQNRNQNVDFGGKYASGIYLYSGKLINLKEVRLKTPFMGRSHFKVEGEKIFASSVQFYSNKGTVYANTRGYYGNFRAGFAQRIVEGKINLYELFVVNRYAGNHFAGNMNSVPMATSKTFRFFNKGLSPLMPVNYKNLKMALSDNEFSLVHLNRYKKKSVLETWVFVLGGALAIGSAISFISKSDGRENPNMALEYAGFTVGAGLYVYGWVLNFSKDDDIDEAIKAYNQ